MGGGLTPLRWLIVIALAFGPSYLGLAADNPKTDPSKIGERNVSKGPNFYSIQKEIALGRQLAAEVERQARILTDPIISEYVNRIGQNIARNSDANYAFTFKILDDDSVNAFALPGGYVFINSGLIEVAEDESELAAAIAHEVAHVAARHLTRQATRSDLLSMARIPVSVILGAPVARASGLGVPLALQSFSRKDETEADYLGVQYLWAAGYDPRATISVFEKLQMLGEGKTNRLSRALSSHPPDSDRIRATQQEIGSILPARDQYVINTSYYREIRQRLIDRQNARGHEEKPAPPTLHTR